MSDDGRHGLTLIAFIGSVFSPYYAWARRRGRGEPEHFCSVNVALYGASGKRWALTERGRKALRRTTSELAIGPSALRWDGEALTIDVDEVTAPIPSRLRGRIRLHPRALVDHPVSLDGKGRHHWRPIAPSSRVEVTMEQPDLRWSGAGYFDTNWGSEALEDGFACWDWSRASLGDGAAILYDVTRRDAGRMSLALRIAGNGEVETFEPPPPAPLATTSIWRIARATQADTGQPARVVETLEDTPFYARSVIATHLLGEPATAVHESLSLDRFRQGWVQMLLPFRMPRLAR
ncbi:carotenoid 1,2-hydratase [Thiococcus pfennigii]|nr:carotenoid 1,2-hydratase [Thiococcus pfennigii]MBK1700644.1 carotenoid 1,2-hydratase [Thiococcus pfennigii]MBK1732796.1 carotenoid 1,2-hydratase [Thiococcus pfennigii]